MADLTGVPVNERSIYLTQITYLEEEIERCQQLYDGLETRNGVLTAQYAALEKHKNESIEHLKRLAAAKGRRRDEQLQAERLQHGLRLQGLQLQHDLRMQQLQQRQDALLAEGHTLATACLKQQQLKAQRTQQIQEKLDSETRMRRLVRNVQELKASIDRLKNAAESQRENAIAAKKGRIERKVSQILLKDRAADAECRERLGFLQKKNAVLPRETTALRDQNGALGLQRDRLKEDLRIRIKEGFTCREALKKTKMECQLMEAELEARSSALRSVQDETDAVRRLVASASDESRQEAAEAARLRAEIQRERRSRRGRERVQREGVMLLTHILRDSEEATETERKLQRLLEILESSAPNGPGSAPSISK